MDKIKNADDFLNAFSNDQTLQIDEEYYDIEDKFQEVFGHRVPREMLPDSFSMEDIKKAMRQCIENRTDNLFEILKVEINDEYLY